jgi:hypothetical protein
MWIGIRKCFGRRLGSWGEGQRVGLRISTEASDLSSTVNVGG